MEGAPAVKSGKLLKLELDSVVGKPEVNAGAAVFEGEITSGGLNLNTFEDFRELFTSPAASGQVKLNFLFESLLFGIDGTTPLTGELASNTFSRTSVAFDTGLLDFSGDPSWALGFEFVSKD